MTLDAIERRVISSFDGTPLGVQLLGPRDAPLLLVGNGLGTTVAAFRSVLARFHRVFRVVAWDYRGLHSSGRPRGGSAALTVEAHARDGLAVLDAVARERGDDGAHHAFGFSMGVQVLLELVRQRPGLTKTLVLHNGVPGRLWQSVGGGGLPLARLFEPLLAVGQRVDGLVTRLVPNVVAWEGFIPTAIRLGLMHHEVDRARILEVARGFVGLDIHTTIEVLRHLGRHDAWDALPQVRCPTLILQGTGDKLTPLEVARRMAEQIPDAELALLPGGTHCASFEMPALMNDHLEAFWTRTGVITRAEQP